jgi:HK97 family phage prohead protease/HK97 family phage major capsid protein
LIKAKSTVAFTTKAADDSSDDLIIRGYANTVAKDRAGDVITADFWKGSHALKDYRKNPVILAHHDHTNAIGKAINFEVDEKGLIITAKISKGAGRTYDLIKDGVLSAFSIGFVIDEAEYDKGDDTFYITKGRVHETSVVAVPCNQDSVFSVSKSLSGEDLKSFESKFKPADAVEKSQIKEPQMDENNISEFQKLLEKQNANTAETVTRLLQEQKAAEAQEKADAEAARKAKEAREANEKAIKDAKEARDLVKEMEAKLNEGNEAFAKALKEREDEVIALKEEITSQLKARNNPVTTTVGSEVSKSLFEAKYGTTQKQVDDVVLLGILTKTNMFETKFGAAHVKAVNASSSITVSSDEYEELFSRNLIMDIQNRIQLAGLFREIPMTQRTLTIPMHPGFKSVEATWVAAGEVSGGTRTKASTGAEVGLALAEKSVQTMKLAAKTFMTEETEEDAILVLLPLLRENLIMAHVNSEEIAILKGSGTNQPLGLIGRAEAVSSNGAVHATTATFNGTTKVTAKMIHQARRKLAEYGRNISDLTLLISNQAYWDLLEDDQWADVNQVGADASVKLRGEVGRIYGIPVLVSDWFDEAAAGSVFGVIFNRQNFIIPRQRQVTVRTDFDIEMDRTVIVATQRLNFEQYFANKGVVAIKYAA